VKDGNILRGWDGYLGKQASSGAIRRINRFREADRMFSASSVTTGQQSAFVAKKVCPTTSFSIAARCGRYECSTRPAQAAPPVVGSASGAKIKKKRMRDEG